MAHPAHFDSSKYMRCCHVLKLKKKKLKYVYYISNSLDKLTKTKHICEPNYNKQKIHLRIKNKKHVYGTK
jgi:hypothetical protein